MKMKNEYGLVEIITVFLTAAVKLVLVNVFGLKLLFIILAMLCWITYILWKISVDKSILKHWGFGKENLDKSFAFLCPIGLVLSVLFMALGYFQGVALLNWHVIPVILLYPIWGTLQQFLILSLVAGNIDDFGLLTRPWNVVLTSFLFGLIHLPDVPLMLATTALAIVYSILFLKWRNLWALGIFHGVLGGLFYFYVLNRDPWVEVFLQ